MTDVLFEINISREQYEKQLDNASMINFTSNSGNSSSTNFNGGSSRTSMDKGRENLVIPIPDSEVQNEIENQQKEAIHDVINKENIMSLSMEEIVRGIIFEMGIKNVCWIKINDENYFKISFCLEKGSRSDETIRLLNEVKIGTNQGYSFTTMPCSFYDHQVRSSETTISSKDSTFKSFLGNVRARLNVAKIVESVKSDAALSFDFSIFLITASIIACFGLVENSMLISPLMCSILAATFGTVIKDRKLQFWGIRNEIIGVFLCMLVGFAFGVSNCLINYIGGNNLKLTNEMLSRCSFHSVFVGICIALASGAALSIALLRDSFDSLSGVAISASLLPPAVNTGLLWSYSCLSTVSSTFGFDYFDTFTATTIFSNDPSTELAILGSISLLVTLTNVLCIYIMGYVFLKLKIEVAPIRSSEERRFWKHDVPIARDFNKSSNSNEGKKNYPLRRCASENLYEFCKGMMRRDLYHNQTQTWSPHNHQYRHDAAEMKKLAQMLKNNGAGDKKQSNISNDDSIDGCEMA